MTSFAATGLLTFSINATLDGCIDHEEGIGDAVTHAFFTCLMDKGEAVLWGRINRVRFLLKPPKYRAAFFS